MSSFNSNSESQNEICDPNKLEIRTSDEILRESIKQSSYSSGPTIRQGFPANKSAKDNNSEDDKQSGTLDEIVKQSKPVRNRIKSKYKTEIYKQAWEVAKEIRKGKPIEEAAKSFDLKKIKNVKLKFSPLDVALMLAEASDIGCGQALNPESIQQCVDRMKPLHQKMIETWFQSYTERVMRHSERFKTEFCDPMFDLHKDC